MYDFSFEWVFKLKGMALDKTPKPFYDHITVL